jgi:hypothetical protein
MEDATRVIIEKITLAMDERKQPQAKAKLWVMRIYYLFGLGGFLLALALASPFFLEWDLYGKHKEAVRELILWLLLVCYLTIIVYGLGFIAFNLTGMKKFFVRPHEQIMGNVSKTAQSDLHHFHFLLTQDVKNLRYALRHIKSEIEYFEARASLIIGSVAKVGIFPALLAFFALTQKMVIPSNSFLQVLVHAMPALYFLSFYDVTVRAKMTRHAALLELAISEIDEEKKMSQSKPLTRRQRMLKMKA